MPLADSFWRMAIAVVLGLLIGLQRERAASRLAGLRSFALFSLFGFLCGTLGSPWIPAAGLLALAAVLAAGNWVDHQRPDADPGVTTEAAALLVFGNGVLLVSGPIALAIAFGVVMAALLAFKVELHSLAARLDDADFKAIVQFCLLSFVVLPVLPDRTFGPYAVFNPRNVWWMVLLIVGIGYAGYAAHKLLPGRAGMLLSGLLGGLVSSTATTVSCARRVAGGTLTPGWAGTVIVMASAVVFARLIFEIAAAAPEWVWQAGPPLALLFALLMALALWEWRRNRGVAAATPLSDPSQLGVALLFGFIYSAILLASAAARELLGDRGLYLVAAVSGLTDVDAITLSTARLVHTGSLDGAVGWKAVMTAALANLAAKAAMAASIGGVAMLRQLAVPFGVAIAAGLLAIWLY